MGLFCANERCNLYPNPKGMRLKLVRAVCLAASALTCDSIETAYCLYRFLYLIVFALRCFARCDERPEFYSGLDRVKLLFLRHK